VVENGPTLFLPVRVWMVGAVVVALLVAIPLVLLLRRRRS
jgi:hypothetical protein